MQPVFYISRIIRFKQAMINVIWMRGEHLVQAELSWVVSLMKT